MNREQLGQSIATIFESQIMTKLIEKNKSYGAEKESAFYNFEQTGKRLATNSNISLDELDACLLPLFAYMDKHQVALMQNLSKTPEFKERIIDNIVYGFIALVMTEYYEKTNRTVGAVKASKISAGKTITTY